MKLARSIGGDKALICSSHKSWLRVGVQVKCTQRGYLNCAQQTAWRHALYDGVCGAAQEHPLRDINNSEDLRARRREGYHPLWTSFLHPHLEMVFYKKSS